MACNVKRVTIRRTPCYGHCPVYELSVSGDGEVEYSGEWFVAREGVHIAHPVTAHDFQCAPHGPA